MSGWQIGDIALCVNQSRWVGEFDGPVSHGPVAGRTYTVVDLVPGSQGLFLAFPEWRLDCWLASRFIKVTPPREMIEQERCEGVPA